MTDDLISRGELLAAMKQHGNRVQGLSGKWETAYSPGVRLCMEDVQEAPAVDAEPVRHSRWRKAGLERLYYCHDCGNYADMKYEGNLKVENLYRYCPHCGAKMQEGVERE